MRFLFAVADRRILTAGLLAALSGYKSFRDVDVEAESSVATTDVSPILIGALRVYNLGY